MSNTAHPNCIYPEVLRRLDALRIDGIAYDDAKRAIDQVAPKSMWLFIWAAEDAGVGGRVAVNRLASIWLANAAVNIADDIADGDHDYLPERVAPGVSFLLLAAAGAVAADGEVPVTVVQRYLGALARAAAGQSTEVRTSHWLAPEYQRVAGLIAGQQYVAYLRLLWEGTTLSHRAEDVGHRLGCLGLVATDAQSNDQRFRTLCAADRQQILEWCSTLTQSLAELPLRSIQKVLQLSQHVLHDGDLAH